MGLAYEGLTEPERAVWNAIVTGALVKLPLNDPAADDAGTGETWGQDRQIRGRGPALAAARILRACQSARLNPRSSIHRRAHSSGRRCTRGTPAGCE